MHSWMDIVILTVLLVAGFVLFWTMFAWAHDLTVARESLDAEDRKEYQRRINHIIGLMAEHKDAEIYSELEWQLHTLLYEYRKGLPWPCSTT